MVSAFTNIGIVSVPLSLSDEHPEHEPKQSEKTAITIIAVNNFFISMSLSRKERHLSMLKSAFLARFYYINFTYSNQMLGLTVTMTLASISCHFVLIDTGISILNS